MKKLALTATVALAAPMLIAGAAAAQSMEARPYVGAGVTILDGGVNLNAATLRAGADLGSNFGIEAEASTGISDDYVGATEYELNHLLAGFAKLRAPLSPNFEVFARGGYYFADYDATTLGVSTSPSDDDFAAGVGAQWNIAGPHALRAEYTNYGLNDDGDSVALSYLFRF